MICGCRAAMPAAVVLLALASPALAASTPAPTLGKPQQAIQIRNRAHHAISYAAATVTGVSHPLVFTPGHNIQESMGQMVYVPAGSCITGVVVRFTTGRTLKLNGQHDCHKPTIEVEQNAILLTSGSVTNPPPTDEHRGEVLTPTAPAK